MRRTYRYFGSVLASLALVLSALPLFLAASPANAAVKGLSEDFAAAEPASYNHLYGGGKWNSGNINTDIVRSLAGEDFKCGDVVSYLSKFTTDNSSSIADIAPFTITSQFNFDLDTTGQSGAVLGDVVSVAIDPTDSAQSNDGGSVATILSEEKTGPMFTKGSELIAKISLSDLEPNEVIVIRMNVKIFCDPTKVPTGDLQAKFKDASITFKNGSTPVEPPISFNPGIKTVPLKNLNALAIPKLVLTKTVTTGSGTCPGVKSLTVLPNAPVKYCYAVTSADNGSGNPASPIYNISDIADDSGTYPDFTVAITSGLSDQDGDGVADDLAAGATAYAEASKSFDATIDTTLFNTAVVNGYDSIINPNQLSATDNATLIIDVPSAAPSISINKLTNGSDSPTILVGNSVTWSYQLVNTGNTPLTIVSVIDDKGVSVTCPQTSLASGQSITCDGSGTAMAGPYTNSATVTANYLSETVTATDSSAYFGASPSMTLEKKTNGVDEAEIAVGDTVTWTYLVTNTGNIAIDGLLVVDDQGVAVSCPTTTLAIGASTTCTGTGTAKAGYYENIGTARANFQGTVVSAQDTSRYFGVLASMTLSKTTNGQDGGTIIYLTPIEWQYLVTNTGNVTLSNIAVIDDKGLTVNCPVTSLAPLNSTTCLAKGVAGEGNYTNIGSVTANYKTFNASANDASNYFGARPELKLKKYTNGGEAPDIHVGDSVTWTYIITNTGNVVVSGISITDDQNVAVTCPKSTLQVAEEMTCSGSGVATAGWYRNLGTVNGTFDQTKVSAQDSSTYFGSAPSITLDKRTNGSDSPTITVGSPVVWTYQVTNTGNVQVDSVTVTDNRGVSVSCPKTSLLPTEVMQCSASGTATAGAYTNIGTATASYKGLEVSATDASAYFGAAGSIDLQKSPDTQTVVAGGTATFTITVTNTGNIPLTNITVVDPLATSCSKNISSLAVAEVYTYSCSKTNVVASFINIATVTANTGNTTVGDSDTASVLVDFLPDITLSKTASVTTVPATGGYVDYTLRITNIGQETVVVTSLTDTKVALSPACNALIGQLIGAGSYLQCLISNVWITSSGESSFTNTAVAVARDPEMNTDSATATAIVTFGWYGRTPGYWKNHPELWNSGYTPNQYIQDVFNVPTVLLKSGVLDINKPAGKDRLIDGLAYQGGSTLSGGFEILMRSAIAALLNEAYYGVYYPGATSTSALIAQVNTTLATQNRAEYLTLASYFDYWNNAFHSSLP